MAMCSVESCGRKSHSRGWCYPHYSRWWRSGDLRIDEPIGEAKMTSQTRKKISDSNRGKRADGQPIRGSFISTRGYRILTGRQGHPLADSAGGLPEHRAVLYEKIGSGEHSCHWCAKPIEWGSSHRGTMLCADHLDHDPLNNDQDNLVPSCFKCNWDRGRESHRPRVESNR